MVGLHNNYTASFISFSGVTVPPTPLQTFGADPYFGWVWDVPGVILENPPTKRGCGGPPPEKISNLCA